jgi:hypothetical protein
MKVCSKCGETKSLSDYYHRKGKAVSQCKSCVKAKIKEGVENNKEAVLRRKKEEYYRNREDRLAQKKINYAEDPSAKQRSAEWRKNNREKTLLILARSRAKKQGVPFDLQVEDIEIPINCPILGIPLVFGKGKPEKGSPTLDKFVPSLGYVKGNVTVISHLANRIKNEASAEEVQKVAEWMKQKENKSDNTTDRSES